MIFAYICLAIIFVIDLPLYIVYRVGWLLDSTYDGTWRNW